MLFMDKISFSATCGFITIAGDDGLVDYDYKRTNKNVTVSDKESIKGTVVVKQHLSKSGTLTLTVSLGTDLEEKLDKASLLNLPFVGTIIDERNSKKTKSMAFMGGLVKPDIQYSSDTITFEILGNFQDIIY